MLSCKVNGMAGRRPGRPGLWDYIDLRLEGRLAEILTGLRSQHGDNATEIWFWLRTDHDVNVSTATVQRWLHRLDAEDAA